MPVGINDPTNVVVTDYYSGPEGSGMEPVSGINASGDTSGPWFIEEQTLDFVYSRVPNITLNFSGINLDLDTASATYNVADTCLVIRGRAKYSVTKSYRFFDSSTYQQGQKFEVVPVSADYLGNTYGTVSAGTFGPAGEVNTVQKFYNRRPWDASSDSETFESVRFMSVYETDSATGKPLGNVGNKFGKFDYWWLNEEITCGIQGIESSIEGFIDLVPKSGPYITTQDTTRDVPKLLDLVGDTLTELKFFGKTAQSSYTPDGGDTGISQYRSDRHTYL